MINDVKPNVSRPKLIINADDFGRSPSINQAVLLAFKSGLIDRASIMSNMPGFEEACKMTHQFNLLGRIGVHLNLSLGPPMTSRMTECARFCGADGNFCPKRHMLRITAVEAQAVEEEFEAQIQAVVDGGIGPAHLDSHHHYHTEWPVGTAAIRVAQKYNIPAIRLSRNCGPSAGVIKATYKAVFNGRLRRLGLARTRYFGSVLDASTILGQTKGDVEVMVHPDIDGHGRLIDVEKGEAPLPLAERLAVLSIPAAFSSAIQRGRGAVTQAKSQR